ncbi:MAG: hypothetical protein HYV09_31550 [Deltaproteobacteria bacterium]|nr:hypothetical protein [Deltaproteobacteria bacterium]
MLARLKLALDGFYEFLQRPLFLWSRPVLALLVIPIILATFKPLWHFDFEAPQYPKGLSFEVFSYKLESGHDGNDLREINILNHYIGMKKLDHVELDDLDWMPFGFGIVAILLLRVAAIGNVRALVDLCVIIFYFGAFSAGRFVYKLWSYGHHLAPDAPVKVEPFMPVIMGVKKIGNFTTYGRPVAGTYFFTAAVLGVVALTLVHLIVGRIQTRREAARREKAATA